MRNRLTAPLYAVAGVFYALFIWRTSFVVSGTRYFVLFEDAMISMRYARNFATGNGLNWNAGEAPVEGYTNLLWTLWMSLFHKLSVPENMISLCIMLTGVGIMLGLGYVAGKLTQKVTESDGAPLAATAATLFCYPLVFWTLRGMEVGAASLLLSSILLLALDIEDEFSLGKALLMGVLGAAAVLLRSDAAVSVGMMGCYAAYASPKGKRILALGLVGGMVAGTVVLHTGFRMSYYHEKVPNTAYLKLGSIPLPARLKRGGFVALQVLAYHLAIPLAFIVASLRTGILAGLWRARESRRLLFVGSLVSVQIAYAVYVGGDAWEWMLYANRYLSAAMPALIVLTTALVSRAAIRAQEDEVARSRFATMLGFSVALLGVLLLGLEGFAKVRPEQGIARTIVFSKKAAAAGVAWCVLGGILFAMKDSVKRNMASFRFSLGGSAILVAALIWLPGQLEPYGLWAKNNAAQYQDEARYARLGLLLAKTTPKDFRIAVVAAGATPYFADRPTEDLLGKNDAVIAKEKPRGVFSPGHDKWDYEHSLGAQKPDLIVELSDVTPEDEAYIKSLGFETWENGLQYRKGGRSFDEALKAKFDTNDEVAAALASVKGPKP